ncbi:MAG: gliding motility-associated C-terminal domain-containing protein [Candidatus Latescibacterota bacterium]
MPLAAVLSGADPFPVWLLQVSRMLALSCPLLLALSLLLGARPAAALDSLVVGQGVRGMGWQNISSWGQVSGVTVKFDSVFNWDVSPGGNLSLGAAARGHLGATYRPSDTTTATLTSSLPGLERLVDGDPATAFSPDDLADLEVPRTLRLQIDLGGAFRANRIRLYPRLDPEHRLLFPQILTVSTYDGAPVQVAQGQNASDLWRMDPVPGMSFSGLLPNHQPVLESDFPTRQVRVVRLQIEGVRRWELAEVEVYGDGSVPTGVFSSISLAARHTFPVWSRMRYEGGDISRLPVVVQTRTGTDTEPVMYFRRTGVGGDLERVNPGTYGLLPEEERGPTRPNPDWSGWETVSDGRIRSPGLRRFIQFRVFFPEPGLVLRRLILEYAAPPLVQEIQGEVAPREVEPGLEETFTLSVVAYLRTSQSLSQSNTGFRRLEVETRARIAGVDQVLVDDVPVGHRVLPLSAGGFAIRLDRPVLQDGTFIQVRFRAQVFQDGTRFDARVADDRVAEGRPERVVQSARPADVDPDSPGGELTVRFRSADLGDGLLAHVLASAPLFTPNGDGVHDGWHLSYDLLKLAAPARLSLRLHDLQGRLVREVFAGPAGNGHRDHVWDGADQAGRPVPPGTYLYRLQVDAEQGSQSRQGLVGVAY